MSQLSENVATFIEVQSLVINNPPTPTNALKVTVAVYDYSKVGGNIGTYNLPFTVPLPQGAVLVNLIIQEVEPVTSAAAYQGSVGINTDDDYATGITITPAPQSYSGSSLRADTEVYDLKWVISNNPITGGVAYFKLLYF